MVGRLHRHRYRHRVVIFSDDGLELTGRYPEGVAILSGEMTADLTLPEGGVVGLEGVETYFEPDGMVEVPQVVRVGRARVARCGPGTRLHLRRHNGLVNLGLGIVLDRLFNLSGPPGPMDHIGLSSDNSTVTASTTTAGGAVSIKTYSPAASRTGQVVTAGATWTQADVAFVIHKIFLLNTATDAGTGLLDVIGGAGGAAPYNNPFTIDLTTVPVWSLVLQIALTAAAT